MKPTVDILLNPHPRVTEVTAVVLPGEGLLRAAWADATPEREAIHLGTVDPDGRLREEDGWDGIQPRLASLGGRLALLFLGAPDLRPTLVLDGGEPLVLGQAPGHQPCLAGGAKDAWAAWCEHDPGGPGWQVLLGRLQADGRFEHVARVPGTACGLGSAGEEARLIWVADGEVRCARLGEQGPGETEVVALDTRAELPVLAADAAGRWYAAWQGPYAHGVLRWPRLARREEDGRWRRLDPPLPLEDMHLEREDAGEDQGWEAPALLCHGGGGPWLAGRSAQGFRAQKLSGESWSPRLDLSRAGWSGRSRTLCLVELNGAVRLLRGTPGGLSMATLVAPGGEAAPSAQVSPQPPEVVPGPEPGSGERPLFGDIHQHSLESDGLGTPEDVYRRARDLYGHDFAALTDHDGLAGGCIGPLTWRRQVELADAFYEPGRFVTLRGFEFTGSRLPGRGHKCVYFDDQVPPALPGRDPERLDELLAAYPALATPHHTAWTGADLEGHDPRVQPVWEVCSVHGSYEDGGETHLPPRPDVVLPGQFIQDALAAGLRFGLIGGTDAHGLRWHHGVGFKADPHRCGLAAVFCEPTRESLLAALRARACYATSGARILLTLDLQGAPMGSEVELPGPAELVVRVHGTAPIRRLSLLQDGQEVASGAGGPDLVLRHTVSPPRGPGATTLRVTLVQRDGEAAWSSPIWLK